MQEKFQSFALLTILCFICYGSSLRGTYVFDDTVAIVKNKDVTNPSTALAEIFQHDFWGMNLTDPTSHKSYRPLTILMFLFEYNYLQLRSFGMKVVNLIFHCLNSCLVYQLFRKITGRQNCSLVGGILFAVHPVHTEAVCGTVGRADLMFCFCLLAALVLFLDIDGKSAPDIWFRYTAVVGLSTMALLSKETGIMILPLCIILESLVRVETSWKQFLNMVKPFKIILLIATVLQLLARLAIQNFESPKFKVMDNPIAATNDFSTRALSQSFLYVLNTWIMINPQWLCFDWALGCVQLVTSVLDFRVASILCLYFAFYKLTTRGDYVIMAALALLVVPFLPASGILKVGFVIGERVLYAPSIGICLLVANGVALLHRRWSRIVLVSLSFLVLVFILRTRQRAAEWTTEKSLFASGLQVCPNNAKIHYNIARLSTDEGNKKKAFEYYHNAIRLYPKYEAALMNVGNLYREIGDFESAERYIRKSLKVLEEFPAAWMNLGIAQASQGKYSDALESYNKALKYRKVYPACHYNLGNLYLEMKDFSLAMKHWHESIALNPKQPKAWANILTLLDNRSLWEDVLRLSDRALEHLPNDNHILFIRANVHGKLKQYVEAEKLYNRVLATDPKHLLGRTNLGVLYHRWGKKEEAIRSYRNALQINPDIKTAKDNLRKLLGHR